MSIISPGLFRLLLAMVIVVHHSVDFLVIGHAAVYVFFILSGYWIAKMYKEKYQYLNSPYKTFMISRYMRLMPVYYLVLLISIGVIYVTGRFNNPLIVPDFHFIFSNVFITSLTNEEYKLLLPAWSLDIELQFYFIAPFLLYITNTVNIKKQLLITIVITLVYVFTIGFSFITIINFLPFFIMGMMIYLLDIKYTSKWAYICLIMALLIYGLHYIVPFLKNIFLVQKKYMFLGLKYRECINVLLAVLTIPYITLNVRLPQGAWNDKLFSSMSFIIYLFHWPANLFYSGFVTDMSTKEKLPYWIGYVVSCILFSFIISKFYDFYFEKIRYKYLASRKIPT